MARKTPAEMISCLYVLTRRMGAAPAAIRQFLEQDYGDSELILIDDAGVSGLLEAPETERVRLLQLPRGMSYDEKLRYAGENAAGAVLCEWAPGVFHAPERLRAQRKATRRASVLDTAPGTRMWRKGAFDAKPKLVAGGELFRAGEVAREGGPPLVSCVLPTRNRRWAVPLALRWFLAQDYPAKELIVVDDGEMAVEDLVRGHEEVRYVRVNGRMTVGAKRNLGCLHARGEYVAHWDDDDWVAPWRLSYQVGELEATGAELCGVEQMLYWEPLRGRAYRYVYPANEKRWVAGGSFVYRHSTWERLPFPDLNVGEDNAFVWGLPEASVLPLADFDFYVALLHAGNTSLKLIEPTRWAPADAQGIVRMLGPDAGRYVEALRELEGPRAAGARDSYLPPEAPLRPGASKEPPQFPDVRVEPFTVAMEEHLRLPEFAALRAAAEVGGTLGWEIPYAMFQARLSDEMRALDCSAELTGLGEAIAELYPRVAYTHWPPVTAPRTEGGPVYDRVFCLRTLEGLEPAGREEWMGAMAALLRPGGRMVCTVDARAGLGAEELAALAGRHGMEALGEAPRGRDEGLVGAVFTRGPEAGVCREEGGAGAFELEHAGDHAGGAGRAGDGGENAGADGAPGRDLRGGQRVDGRGGRGAAGAGGGVGDRAPGGAERGECGEFAGAEPDDRRGAGDGGGLPVFLRRGYRAGAVFDVRDAAVHGGDGGAAGVFRGVEFSVHARPGADDGVFVQPGWMPD